MNAQDISARGRTIAQAQAADQSYSIPYRPQYTFITGTPTAAILLQQVSYWWHKSDCRPFYKFKEPCEHASYKIGDSWCEELGFSRAVFDTALRKIGTKITTGMKKSDEIGRNLVIYWTDSSRRTWYQVNEELLGIYIYLVYNDLDLLAKVEMSLYLDKAGNALYLDKAGNALYLYSETTIPEITTSEPPASVDAIPPEQTKQDDILDFHDGVVPEVDQEPTPTKMEKRDAVVDIVQQAARRDDPLWWLKPGTRCGDHDYLEPYRVFCEVIERDPSTVGEHKTLQWEKRLAKMAVVSPGANGNEPVIIQPGVMAQAIKAIRGDWNFEHKRWSTPYHSGFSDLVELTAAQIVCGEEQQGPSALAKAGYDVTALNAMAQRMAAADD